MQVLVFDHLPVPNPRLDPFTVPVASEADANRLATSIQWRVVPVSRHPIPLAAPSPATHLTRSSATQRPMLGSLEPSHSPTVRLVDPHRSRTTSLASTRSWRKELLCNGPRPLGRAGSPSTTATSSPSTVSTSTSQPGQVHGLVGPNGAGKTTLLGLLLGVATADAGTLEILGRPVGRSLAVADGVAGFVDGPGLYPSLTARQNLAALAALRGIRAGRSPTASTTLSSRPD